MLVQLDTAQIRLLEEILSSAKHNLLTERARTDAHDLREQLQARESLVEAMLAKLTAARRSPA